MSMPFYKRVCIFMQPDYLYPKVVPKVVSLEFRWLLGHIKGGK